VSAARAFLYPAISGKGVAVRTDAPASAIVFQGKRAVGVRYLPGGTGPAREVRARKEVIVACGTLNSPKLLQLSGVGPGPLLQRLGIEVRHALAGIGENLSDHYTARIVAKAKGTITINNLATGPRILGEIGKWLLCRPNLSRPSAA